MEVKISFDTEKENVEDIKKLVAALQDLISKREKASNSENSITSSTITKSSPIKMESTATQQTQPVKSGQTSSGGRVIPYEDMSSTMSKLFAGKL